MNPERLGAIDVTYLDAEEPRVPLHVASLAIFEAGPLLDGEGRLRLGELQERIERRLGLLPRLRQRVQRVPGGVARPVWVDDEGFDITRHVDAVELPAPGDDAALLHLVEELLMVPLDRSHPLWHLRFVTGLSCNRVALVERAHHAMVDGVSGVDVSMVLLDTEPGAPVDGEKTWQPEPAPTPAALVVAGLADRVAAPLSAAIRVARSVLHPDQLIGGIRQTASALGTLGRSGWLAPKAPTNEQVGATRQILVTRVPFDDLQAAAARAGTTVNDVVLSVVAGGVRTLFESRGEPVPAGRVLKTLIPVSLRDESHAMTLGNRVGGMFANLPIGIADCGERLAAVHEITTELKASPEAATSSALLGLADLLPLSAARAIGRAVHHQPFVNTVITNVPGPPFPLYAMGSRMIEAIPIVPLGGNMDFEVAVLSYDGALTLCVTADRATCPDAQALMDGIESAFGELGVRSMTPIAASSQEGSDQPGAAEAAAAQ